MADLTGSDRLLWSGFIRASEQFPDRSAISVSGREIAYVELAERAKSLAATLQRESLEGAIPLTAVFAYRSETAYVGVLAALMAGHGYVPLNRTFPVDRTRLMLERALCQAIIVDASSESQVAKLLPDSDSRLVLIFPERSDVRELAEQFPQHRVLGAHDLSPAEEWDRPEIAPDSLAYLLFTSGITGQPKGVMVSHRNVLHYVEYMTKRHRFHQSRSCFTNLLI